MAMLSSYTTALLSRAPPVPGKSSPAAALQLRSRQPPAAASVVALRWAASCKEESRSRAALFRCHANKDKYTYDIEPSALVQTPKLAGDHWSIMVDKDLYVLKLRVGETTSKEKLDIETKATENDVRLVIRYTGNADDASPATELNVELKMPPGYDAQKQAHASKFDEWLIVVIAKPKQNPNKTTVQ